MQKSAPLEGLQFVERLIIFVVLILVGLGFSLILDFPAALLMILAVGTVTCIGTVSVLRAHPIMRFRPFFDTVSWWFLPATLTVSACIFLRLFDNRYGELAGLALTGLLLLGILTAQYHLLDPADEYRRTASQGLLLATYLTAFAAMAAIYSTKVRSLQTGTAVFVVATLLTHELLRDVPAARGGVRRRWLYALVAGLCMGETIWALNYLALSGPAGGAILLLTYYVISGVAHEHLAGRLNRGRALEYGAISFLGLVMILLSRFLLG
jgi:hypothetical protein